MKVKNVKTPNGGVATEIHLNGNELATAILTYLTSKSVVHTGSITISVNGELCDNAKIYVYPEGQVLRKGKRYYGSEWKPEGNLKRFMPGFVNKHKK